MTEIKSNILILNTLKKHAPAANRGRIQLVIDMYKNRSIKNIKTVLNTVNLLSSTHKSQQQKAQNTYGKTVSKALNDSHKAANNEIAKFKKLVETPHTVKTGTHTGAKSHIDFMIGHHEKDTSVSSLLNSLRSSMYNELKKNIN